MKISAYSLNGFSKTVGKLIISLFFIILMNLVISGKANAQVDPAFENNYNSYGTNEASSTTYNTNSAIKLNSHNAIQILMIDFLSAISCQLAGVDPTNPDAKCLGVNRNTGEIGFVENGGGAILVVAKMIDKTLTPPTSSMQYIAYLKNNFGITKNAYAQAQPTNPCLSSNRGIGFCALEPLLPAWKVMRNLVYLLFILVFIIVGIGIMLRLHIDPRTIMTIQNQIPKIIVGILAITFSFAIAGFLIDIMWASVYLFIGTIATATNMSFNNVIELTHATDPFQAVNAAWQVANPQPSNGPLDFDFQIGIYDIASRTATSFSDIVEASLREIADLGWLWNLFGFGIDILATIILFIAIIILLIRLFIVLILAFVNIILDVIFAPWWILAGLLPGGPLGLGAWIRDMIANLAVFPLTLSFMLLGAYLMREFYRTSEADQLAGLNFPMLGSSVNGQAIAALIGFGFILMLPNLLKTTKAALKSPNMSFGPMFGPVGSATGIFSGVARGGIDEAANSAAQDNNPSRRKNALIKGAYITGIARRISR